MSNPMKDIFDKESMIKDIAERENIICNYQKYGLLDRENAIKKIQELDLKKSNLVRKQVREISYLFFSLKKYEGRNYQCNFLFYF